MLIAAALDGDITSLTKNGRLVWMPVHGNAHVIDTVLMSDNKPISAFEWRANRLAWSLRQRGPFHPARLASMPAAAAVALALRLSSLS